MAIQTFSREASKDEMAREIDRRGTVIVQLEKAAHEAATAIEARDAEIAKLTAAHAETEKDACRQAGRANELAVVLNLALEYWAHRQQRYKNRHPVWVQNARAALKVSP